jgi:hypothetical protein
VLETPHPPLEQAFASLAAEAHAESRAHAAMPGIANAITALILAAIASVCAILAEMAALWRAGQLPARRPRAPRAGKSPTRTARAPRHAAEPRRRAQRHAARRAAIARPQSVPARPAHAPHPVRTEPAAMRRPHAPPTPAFAKSRAGQGAYARPKRYDTKTN